MTRDRDVKRKQKTMFTKVKINRSPAGILTFDLSYLVKNRNFIYGPYLKGTQGDHAICFSIMISSLEKCISNRTLSDLLRFIVSDRNLNTRSLHKDILILFHLYSKVVGSNRDFYIRDRLQRLHNSWKSLISGVYTLDVDSQGELQFIDTQENFFELLTNYLLDYAFLLQFLPFSTSYAKPGEGSGNRGEASARKFIEKLDCFSPFSEAEILNKFSRLLDPKAIENVINEFSQHSFDILKKQKMTEIVAFQLLSFLGILEGYPTVKEHFFGIHQGERALLVSRAKLKNLAYILFGEGNHSQDYSKIESALELIANLRRAKWQFDFLI
jgi:hypothetical protein